MCQYVLRDFLTLCVPETCHVSLLLAHLFLREESGYSV